MDLFGLLRQDPDNPKFSGLLAKNVSEFAADPVDVGAQRLANAFPLLSKNPGEATPEDVIGTVGFGGILSKVTDPDLIKYVNDAMDSGTSRRLIWEKAKAEKVGSHVFEDIGHAELTQDGIKALKNDDWINANDVLENKLPTNAFDDTKLIHDPDGSYLAYYDRTNNRIGLNLDKLKNKKDLSSALNHELAHKLHDTQGISPGSSILEASSLKNFADLFNENIKKDEDYAKWLLDNTVKNGYQNKYLDDIVNRSHKFTPYELYMRDSGEYLARLSGKRSLMDPKVYNGIYPTLMGDLKLNTLFEKY